MDSGWITDLRGQLALFGFRLFVNRIAERFTLIRFDKPGVRLVDRDWGAQLSFEEQIAAAIGVADAVGVSRFRMFGASQGAQLAAAVAARHPERVERLVLYGTCADGGDLAPSAVRESGWASSGANWGLGLKALVGTFMTDPSARS